jgi:hypothetical protein
MTPQEFATKIKAKYPQYKDVDDLELAQKVVAKYPAYKSQVNLENGSTEPQNKGFIGRVADDFKNRGQKVTETLTTFANNENANVKDVAQSGFNVAGQFAGGALDIVGEGIKSIIPKAAETGLSKLSNKIADAITENPRVLTGLNAVNGGIDKYNEWKTQNPEDAKSLEGAVNIGLLFAGAKGDVNITTKLEAGTTKTADLFKSIVEKQKTKAALNTEEKVYRSALDKVTPDYNLSTPTERLRLQSQTVNGTPRVTEGGVIRGRKVTANSVEKKAADELVKVPGFDPKATNLETNNLVKS